jgi:Nitroreductase family/EF-hand domain pair
MMPSSLFLLSLLLPFLGGCSGFAPLQLVFPRSLLVYPRRTPPSFPYSYSSFSSSSSSWSWSWSTSPSPSYYHQLLASPADLAHAREVFVKFDENQSGSIDATELLDMLSMLDIPAQPEEADALCKYLDVNGDGEIDIDDFLPWYGQAVDASRNVSQQFQSLLIGRRTVDAFDQTPVADDVLERAVQCAIAAPNRCMSEPWRFIQAGPVTVQQFAQLNRQMMLGMETDNTATATTSTSPVVDWLKIPGWCIVTTKLTGGGDDDETAELEDYKSTCCAIQNFMLSMWSEGIATKWTSGPVQKTPEFAKICNIDMSTERVVGCIWYGFAAGGLVNADPKRRVLGVKDVLRRLP